ncbi:MAG: T9SS type A sorting domain-containing protein [Bacteroidetes bacterium]|nr:T9SS type A sorting domain-containing protein [Bacteroidota bacterium]MBP9550021.1 T9SS type A sorting domain-containing protein [Chitinophagales bacterium]
MKKGYSLSQYSLAAGALIVPATAFSQAVYTDVDPDIILDVPGEYWGFDLDMDGLNDFNFFNKSFTTTVWYGVEGQVKALFAGVFDNMQNGLNGHTVFFSGNGGYTYYRPYALESNISIKSTIPFYNANYQTLAMTIYKPEWPPSTAHRGDWNSYFWGPQIEKFIGFRFTDDDFVKRYGWIRCSVVDSNRTLIIHDYAYESKPDTPIHTGDTIGDTTTVSINNTASLNAVVYSFNKDIYIRLQEYNDAEYFIYDVSGRLVYNEKIKNATTICNIELPGLYLVNIKTAEGKQFSKKLVVSE